MEKGSLVELETFDHELIKARLVEIRGRTAIVCSDAEWTRAANAQREPHTIGWPRSGVRIVRGTKSGEAETPPLIGARAT